MSLQYRFLVLGLASQLVTFASFASPFPATSTSVLTAPDSGLYMSPLGFRLKTDTTNWKFHGPESNSLVVGVVKFQPENPKNPKDSPTLSIRIDQVGKTTSLETYAKRWIRDYPYYGFDIMGTKAITIEGQKGFLIDLVHVKKSRQLRQVVLQKENRAVVMTCSDKREDFEQTLAVCNQIIKTFKWVR
jgi:hypothetical protein